MFTAPSMQTAHAQKQMDAYGMVLDLRMVRGAAEAETTHCVALPLELATASTYAASGTKFPA